MGSVMHIVLLPAMAHGHMIPILDMAKLFNSRGLKTTIIATPSFADSIKRAQESGHDVGLSIVNFPPEKSSLPKNIVSLDQLATPDLIESFLEAIFLLREPVEKLLQELSPSCLVSDTFLPWTLDSAAKLGIPRLVFHGISCRALCALEQMDQKSPFSQQMRAADGKSYGVIINSFYELESACTDYYKNITGKKAWHIGPLLLCSKNKGELLAQRGKASSMDEQECLSWLSSKKPASVVYVCFGSIVTFTRVQLYETAAGLEASGQDFIWVVRHETGEDWLPRGFEERTRGKGLIIRGWAPQVMILGHPSTGAFVTHCGWNSTLEGICAGVPMVTWPAFAEQFSNEEMVTEVLGIGVAVGNNRVGSGCVPREVVETAVRRIMVAEEMRRRAKCYKKMARKAVEEGGSSYHDLSALIDELSIYATPSDYSLEGKMKRKKKM